MGRTINKPVQRMSHKELIFYAMGLEKDLIKMQAFNLALKGYDLQQALDVGIITLNQEFGFGADRCRKWGEAFNKLYVQFMDDAVADFKDDEDAVYTRENLDRLLRQALGPEILPYDERYDADHLYFKDELAREQVRAFYGKEEEA